MKMEDLEKANRILANIRKIESIQENIANNLSDIKFIPDRVINSITHVFEEYGKELLEEIEKI